MSLKVYNTLSKRKEEFKPIHPGKVSMYVCGITVYDDIHMGHARSMVVFDMVARYLRYKGFTVDHATNFTDVDDKIIDRAKEQGVPPLQLSSMYIERYFKEADALGVRRADRYPKASEYIPQIIKLVQALEQKGFAYRTRDGSVYFSMEKARDYGKLSGMKLDELKAGARIEPGEEKRNPVDFALWKGAKPGEIAWDSPWGRGRPGWHIECSAMCMNLFGETIDIHGGGNDLIFPHHENEILQSESATGKPLANYWLHNGMLTVQEEKMAKSLKNFFTVRQVLSQHTKEEVRFYLLNTHYRGPLGYSDAALDEAAASLRRLHNTYAELRAAAARASGNEDCKELVEKARKGFIEQMDDDFNSRAAIAEIFDMAREANRLMAEGKLSKEGAKEAYLLLEEVDQVLGVLPSAPIGTDDLDAVMQVVIEIRKELRKRKMFDLADQIRDKLAAQGIKLEDTAEGAKWKRI
ncbi:MAG TPA: cysteine--tRNA ligase [Methanomassiliicoccales archaeon]|nr:cysteine--tRNA ligase [Methanomassiliicoccales archaeon]